MGLFRRREQTTVDYWGTPVTGDADRFRRAKTTGARKAAREGQAWEDRDRAQDRKGPWYRPAR
ncbi:hypothetical protein ABZX85_23275 [Streptomyces sp. NPDC004539]|uniref:hypothetical protein n=1 Tax=Streptomyces sp. NPDC004539 TaxID=3154280 RepID=UPI0033ACFB9B